MNHSKISVRYAKALFLAAREMKVLDLVYKDISLVRQLFQAYPSFIELLEHPVIGTAQKMQLFEKTFKTYFHPLSYRFTLLLFKNNRETFLPDITRVFISFYKKDQGITEASLATAVEIREDLKEKLTGLLETQLKTEIQFSEIINPDLIGGFILKVEDEQYDASIRRRLLDIKKELSK
jgi:F-type H+-transporting ATPase subunit delta